MLCDREISEAEGKCVQNGGQTSCIGQGLGEEGGNERHEARPFVLEVEVNEMRMLGWMGW